MSYFKDSLDRLLQNIYNVMAVWVFTTSLYIMYFYQPILCAILIDRDQTRIQNIWSVLFEYAKITILSIQHFIIAKTAIMLDEIYWRTWSIKVKPCI